MRGPAVAFSEGTFLRKLKTWARPPWRVDALDFALFRELSRERVFVWGALAPRLSVPGLARAVKVDPTTVRARLKAWKASGFLMDFAQVANPEVFGVGVAAGAVRARTLQDKPKLIDALSVVDGVLHTIEHVGPWVGYTTVADASLDRRSTLISRLPGAVEVVDVFPTDGWPTPSWKPSPVGWRVLRALTAGGPRPLKEMAKEAGVSANTFHAHEERLHAGRAVLLVPELDFRHYSGAVVARVFATLAHPSHGPTAIKTAEAAVPDGALIASQERSRGAASPSLFFTAHLPSMPAVEDLERALQEAPGVSEVEVYFPRVSRIERHWFDQQLDHALRARA